jgi:hypothetical protein
MMAVQEFPAIMEPENSLNPTHFYTPFSPSTILMLFVNISQRIPSGLFPRGFLMKIYPNSRHHVTISNFFVMMMSTANVTLLQVLQYNKVIIFDKFTILKK